ncbi:MAG TPA: class I SAM-dependent methyltransferase [Ktedonobacterales bacterium]
MTQQPNQPDEPRKPKFPQAVEITTAAYDQIASNYAARNDQMRGQWAERMRQFVAALHDAEDERPLPSLEQLGRPGDDASVEEYLLLVPVLDAGCGTGRDARALAAYGLSVLGVDLSQGMLDEAIERTARRLPQGAIRYAVMDLRGLELPDASCRGVWCSASLLHLPLRTAPRATRELARVARSGAPFVVFLKSRRPGEEAERMVPYEYAPPGAGETLTAQRFYAYYTPQEARALLEDAGLVVEDVAIVPDERGVGQPDWISLLAHKP